MPTLDQDLARLKNWSKTVSNHAAAIVRERAEVPENDASAKRQVVINYIGDIKDDIEEVVGAYRDVMNHLGYEPDIRLTSTFVK